MLNNTFKTVCFLIRICANSFFYTLKGDFKMEEKPNYYAIIPANVRYDKKLKAMERLLYAEITALCNKEGYCWATNSYFANLYETAKETISRYISHLVVCGYIKTKIIKNDKNGIEKRIIQISRGIDETVMPPIDETVKENNININNTSNNNLTYLGIDNENKKPDPYIKSKIELYFCEEYKKVFNNKPYILLNQRNKIMELNAGIENFKETIPPVLHKLKNLHFEGISNFTPNYIWLLTDDNYIKVLSGSFEKYKSAWIREMEAKGVDEYGN